MVVSYGDQRFWIIIFWNMIHDWYIHHAFHKVSLEAFLTFINPSCNTFLCLRFIWIQSCMDFLREFFVCTMQGNQPGMLIYKWLYEPLVMKQYTTNQIHAHIWKSGLWELKFGLIRHGSSSFPFILDLNGWPRSQVVVQVLNAYFLGWWNNGCVTWNGNLKHAFIW